MYVLSKNVKSIQSFPMKFYFFMLKKKSLYIVWASFRKISKLQETEADIQDGYQHRFCGCLCCVRQVRSLHKHVRMFRKHIQYKKVESL